MWEHFNFIVSDDSKMNLERRKECHWDPSSQRGRKWFPQRKPMLEKVRNEKRDISEDRKIKYHIKWGMVILS